MEFDGLFVGVAPYRAAWLTDNAFGSVLDLGYGQGVSSLAMSKSPKVTSIVSWEPNPKYLPSTPPPKTTVITGPPPMDGDYDFVFVDCFGWDRKEAALYWRGKGAVVVIDDALLINTGWPGQSTGLGEIIHGMEVLR